MQSKPSIKKINCLICGSETVWGPDNPYRPFCSERCRLIDLGEWLSEKNVIPGEEVISDDPQDS